MFKVFDTQTSKEIIILDPYWNDSTLNILRTMSRDDHLACPVCKEPVLVRAGEIKRWHFAHRNLSDCPLKHESPNLLQARSFLYAWLKSKYPDKVTIEKHFPESGLPRPLDCYVDVSENKKFGYWILDKGIRSRYQIQHALSDLNLEITWIFLSNMLRIDKEKSTSVHLTPTERDLANQSIYNEIHHSCHESITYFNIDDNSVTTLRGLRCIHLPQESEHEKLQRHYADLELKQQRQEEERQLRIDIQKELNEKIRKEAYSSKASVSHGTPKTTQNTSNNDFNKPYPCSICGATTANWAALDLSTNTCICSRECLKRKRENS